MARGSIRERSGPTGRAWELRAFAGRDGTNGAKRYVTQTVRGSRKDAEAALARLIVEVDEGGHRGPKGATLSSLLADWRAVKVRSWSPKTALETAGYVGRWIAPPAESDRWSWTPGRLPLREVTTSALDEWERRLLEHLAPSTVRRIHGVVHAALEQAVRWDWIVRNPASRCEPIEGGPAEIAPPPPADIVRLLEHVRATDPMMLLMLRLAATLGRRRGELCALRWSDIELEDSEVRLTRALVLGDQGWVERPISKNRRRTPALSIGRSSVRLLKAHRRAQLKMLAELEVEPAPDDHVFLTLGRHRDRLGPWSPAGVTRQFARLRLELGISGVRFHDLRHHVATTLIDQGVSMTTIAGRLGHGGGGRTTQEVYGHFVAASDRIAAEALDRMLDG
jgi:integrase